MNLRGAGVLGHFGIPGLAPFIAVALFFGGMGAAVGAYVLLSKRTDALRRAMGNGLRVAAFACFGMATVFPLIVHASPTFTRPSTGARLAFVSPQQGEEIRGSPPIVRVELRLDGGKIVPVTSLHLVPNEGHIHLYLDGSLVSMTGLDAQISAAPGQHSLRAEFVAVDHRPFRPRVLATVTFRVGP